MSGTNWQASDGVAGGSENGVGQRGSNRGNAGLADACGAQFARNDVDLDFRGFEHAEHLVVVEIRLLDAAVFERDFRFESGRQTEDDAAFHLCFDDVWMDSATAIDSADDAMDAHRAVFLHRSFDDLGDVTVE